MARIYRDKGDYIGVLLSGNGDPSFISKIKNSMKPQFEKFIHLDSKDPRSEYIIEFCMSSVIGTLALWYTNGMDLKSGKLATMLQGMLLSCS